MLIVGIIPARFGSSRFPGKPLASLRGRPLIQWVYESAVECNLLQEVVVATDDDRIAEVVARFGGKFVMTSAEHETGTDRIAEVARLYPSAAIIVNIQGDIPLISESYINALVAPFYEQPRPQMTTLACPIASDIVRTDINSVKVACDQSGNALYFSRLPLPYFRNSLEVPVYHHLGLYAFDSDFLEKFTTLPSTPLEKCESLEQLRALEHGFKIRVGLIERPLMEVNTPSDLTEVADWLEKQSYIGIVPGDANA